MYNALCVQWGEPLRNCKDLYVESRECYMATYDLLSLAYSTSHFLMAMLHMSDNVLELQNLYVRVVGMARLIQCPLSIEIALASPQLVVSALRNQRAVHPHFDDREAEFEEKDLPQLEHFSQVCWAVRCGVA